MLIFVSIFVDYSVHVYVRRGVRTLLQPK